MLECPNCYKSVKVDSNTCDYCGFHLPKNKKAIPDYDVSKNRIFSLPADKAIVSTKEWVFLFFILCLPILNLYVVYKYGFKEKQESNIRNFLRGIGVILLILIGLSLLELVADIIQSLT